MRADTSITWWLERLEVGDRAAVLPLWEHCFHRLVVQARTVLRGHPCRVADEEDIALNAFDSFCRRAEQGRFPRLDDSNNLWRILLEITARKAQHQIRDEHRLCRGGGRVRTEADLISEESEGGEGLLGGVSCPEPTPELAAELAEEFRRLLDRLGDEHLRSIAVWQMEGYTLDEIAGQLGRTVRTVTRKLQVIRSLLEQELV
jgi:DNA-directed RNA polymerase specialized sigma24 family protein